MSIGYCVEQPLQNDIPGCAGVRNQGQREEHPLTPAPLPSLQPRSSVLVDPKDPDAVKLRQFGDQDGHEGDGVDYEVYPVVLGVKAG